MKEVPQGSSAVTATAPSIPKSLGWVLGHFALIILICLLALWNIFLSYLTVAGFEYNIQDFSRFYYATLAHLNGQGMYGPTQGTFIQFTEVYAQQLWDLNPPHFHLLIYPLTSLSISKAFVIWICINFAAFLLSGYLILKEFRVSFSLTHWCVFLCGLLGFSGTGFFILTAQVSFLLMLPLTLAWIHARHGQWTKSGIYLGILAGAKLFILIFIPYLILRRHFRATAAMVGTFLGFFCIGLLVFGWQAYIDWTGVLTTINWAWGSTNISFLGFLSRTFSDNPLFESFHIGVNFFPFWFLLSALCGLLTLYAATMDRTQNSIDRSFSLILFGALLISPLGWIYYLFLPMGPLAVLVYSWKKESPRNGDIRHSKSFQLRNTLMLFGISVLFIPALVGSKLQPNLAATILLGSCYFWATLAIWGSLIFDWHGSRKTREQKTLGLNAQSHPIDLQVEPDSQLIHQSRVHQDF